MPCYTNAYSSFLERLQEVETLRKLASNKEKEDPVGKIREINSLCRGSIVLLSSHLEAYIKELGELALDSLSSKSVAKDKMTSSFFYHISKNYIDEIKDTSEPAKIGDKIFEFLESDYLFWDKNGVFRNTIPNDRFNKGFSNPSFDKIKAYLNRFGYSRYPYELKNTLKADFQLSINMVDHLVDTRNKIAHGDNSATKTPSEILTMIKIIQQFTKTTDKHFATWWKSSFCSIR